MTELICGLDLGGTKLEGILMNASGEIAHRERVGTPRDYVGTLDAIGAMVGRLDRIAGCCVRVGIGTPGAWQPDQRAMKNCNSTWLNGRPLLVDIRTRLGDRVRIANDADCLALSEALDGAAAGAGCVFAAILGTGVGGGIVVDGRLLTGPNGTTGEWGHMPLPYFRTSGAVENALADRECYCGRQNCVETFLSGPGFAVTHRELTGDAISAIDVASQGATATLDLYCVMLARSLAQIVNVLDPEVIVLGGGMSNVEELFRRLPDLMTPFVFSEETRTVVRQAMYGDSSGVRGAARLCQATL